MAKLTITRGAPGSGKTTWARVHVDRNENTIRVNRDDLRLQLFGLEAPLHYEKEQRLTVVQQAMVRAALLAGTSVVVDDCHTKNRYVSAWRDLAVTCGAEFAMHVMDTPLELCIARDGLRERVVGADVIRAMHGSLRNSLRSTPEPVSAPYTYIRPDFSRPTTWLIDIDGTLAHMGDRGPFEWHRVGEDSPNQAVVSFARILNITGQSPVVMSGRDAVCWDETVEWLVRHQVPFRKLIMRPEGDNRKDAIVKLEMFREQVAPNYRVTGVLDDRDQVVAMWRSIGLTCFQVAPGAF